MQASNILFRCSGAGHIMGDGEAITEKQADTVEKYSQKEALTDKQAKELARLIHKRDNPELPENAKTHCIDIFISEFYGRKEEVKGKHLDKGNAREEDSITLVSRLQKILYKKNTIRLRNQFVQGEPDIYIGESIYKAEETTDTKTSWSLHTFLRSEHKAINPLYEWQGHGYMDLTGAKKHTVAFCLVNGTAEAITAEKRQLQWRMNVIDPDNDPEYKEKCKQIEINHIFDIKAFIEEYPYFQFDNDISEWKWDIPMQERMHTKSFERDMAKINKMHNRIIECRKWMDENLFKNKMLIA
jgi:hypothetical protein